MIKSPLNYHGGKGKLFPQLQKHFPDDIDTFFDVFCGSCVVGINADAGCRYFSDNQKELIDLFQNLQKIPEDEVVGIIEEIVQKRGLSKTNKEAYYKLREDYNKNKDWKLFYTLICFSFNNQIRFNKSGGFNIPFGKNRSDFNSSLKKKLKKFTKAIKGNCFFFCEDFRKISYNDLVGPEDYVYMDPPYLLGNATYNAGWGIEEEKALHGLLDSFNEISPMRPHKIRFGLSNVLHHKGESNKHLIRWLKNNENKVKVHYLDYNYDNCNYQFKGSDKTVEVLITNVT